MSERITERGCGPKGRSGILRQERAAAAGVGHRPHLTYSSTDCILIMGQGFLAKFIKMIVLETSLAVQCRALAVQGTQVQSCPGK